MKKLLLGIMMGASISAIEAANPITREAALRWSGGVEVREVDISIPLHHIGLYQINNDGLVITTDNPNLPIIGYAQTNTQKACDIPPAMQAWLASMDAQMDRHIVADCALTEEKTLPRAVPALITSTWSQQGNGYNSQVPEDYSLATGHPTVGCAALAMGQVMRYWGYPINGQGTTTYTYNYDCWRYGTLSCDYSHANFDYANMPDELTYYSREAEREAVGRLLMYCGYSLKMLYNIDCMGSSGAESIATVQALKAAFRFNSDAHVAMRSDYSTYAWRQLLMNEIAERRPVLFGAYSPDYEGNPSSGHAFILDGYDSLGRFHVNWGWGGSCDGYYDIATLQPMAGMSFSLSQCATIGLDTNRGHSPVVHLSQGLSFENATIDEDGQLNGTFTLKNSGDAVFDGFIGLAIYDTLNEDDSYHQFYGYTHCKNVTLNPGSSMDCTIDGNIQQDLEAGRYFLSLQIGTTNFATDSVVENSERMFDPYYDFEQPIELQTNYHVGIEENEKTFQIKLYPNPTSKILNIQIDEISLHNSECEIINVTGVVQKRFKLSQGRATLNVADLETGNYFVKIAGLKRSSAIIIK